MLFSTLYYIKMCFMTDITYYNVYFYYTLKGQLRAIKEYSVYFYP